MTISELKQYRSLRREVIEIENEIKSHQVQDTVKASSLSFPYTQHTAIVSGIPMTADVKRLRNKRNRIIFQYRKIEEFVDNIKDSEIRRIIHCKYIDSPWKISWVQLAQRLGVVGDGSTQRKKIYKYLEEK